MKIEEALSIVNYRFCWDENKDECSKHFGPDKEKHCQKCEYNVIKKSLEKQIPKEVNDDDHFRTICDDAGHVVDTIFWYEAKCPTCNSTIVSGELSRSDCADVKFCSICGQMLDWSES